MKHVSPPRILIVEDESLVALDIQNRLIALGYQPVGCAACSEEAVALAETRCPEVALMDIRLQGAGDGIAAAAEIRRRFRVPVIFLTAYAEEATLERAKLVEPFGYLLKPFSDRELKSTIEIALYKHRSEQERLRLEQRFLRTQKAESLDRMAGAIAHLFNNMLYGIMGNLELALMVDPHQEPEVRSHIAAALKTTERAAEIIRSILSYIGQTNTVHMHIDLAKVAREAIKPLNVSLPDHVHLNSALPAHEMLILADAAQIKQVLINLISNAAEAMGDREGQITLTLDVKSAAAIHAWRCFPQDWKPAADRFACLSIADTGDGMEPAIQEKIFDPFFSTKFIGRGLGLPIALGLVQAHQGAISLESSPGQGAIFRVLFPLHAIPAKHPTRLNSDMSG